MKLLVNFEGKDKILLNADSFEDIVKFVEHNFSLKMPKWNMHYIDSDNDEISLDSEVDFNTLIETQDKDEIKIYVVDREKSEQIEHHDDIQINVDKVSEVKEEKETFVNKEQVTAVENTTPLTPSIFPLQKQTVILKNEGLPQQSKQNKKVGFQELENQKEQWKKRIEEKMGKFFDDRLEAMMPCIIKKVEEHMKSQKPKQNKKQGVEHDVKCNGCGIQPIVGICYRSTKISSFNFCEDCEKQVQHQHNMIKMKKPEEEVKEKINDEQGRRFWWKKHWGQGNEMPTQCKGNWANWDPRIGLTKKCFQLSSSLGGLPQDYEKLVEENPKAKLDELVKIYLESHSKKNNQFQWNERAKQNVLKLQFYFKEAAFDFTDVVKNNPFSNLKQLINIVKETKLLENRDVTNIKMKEVLPQNESIHPQKIKPVQHKIDSSAMNQKKNEFVLKMKEFVGQDGVIQYISFFNLNSHKPLEEIVQSYMETKFQ